MEVDSQAEEATENISQLSIESDDFPRGKKNNSSFSTSTTSQNSLSCFQQALSDLNVRESEEILSDILVRRRNRNYMLAITEENILARRITTGRVFLLLPLNDVYAIKCNPVPNSKKKQSIFIYAMSPRKSSRWFHRFSSTSSSSSTRGHREHVIHSFFPTSKSSKHAKEFVERANIILRSSHCPSPSPIPTEPSIYKQRASRRLLILVNPVSGRGRGMSIYRRYARPMLDLAEMDIEEIVTERTGHAYDVIMSMFSEKLLNYTCVLCVGGDGLLHEVINGLLSRSDSALLIPTISLGIIPTGSGNALAESMQVNHPQIAAWNIIKGHTRTIDISTVTMENRTIFSFLFVSFGLIADIDILSETIRWAGDIRFSLAGFYRLAANRLYSARISFLPWDTESPSMPKKGGEHGETGQSESPHNELGTENTITRATLPKKQYDFHGRDGKMTFKVPSYWNKVESDFSYFIALNLPCISSGTRAAPLANFQDGYLDMQFIERAPRIKLLRGLFTFNEGNHTNLDFVKYYHVKALYLEPLGSMSGNILDIDGESYPFDSPVLLECHKNAVRFICPLSLDLPVGHPPLRPGNDVK